MTRLHESMLGDPARGLSAQEIAELTGFKIGTVRTYLSQPQRKRELADRIRADESTKVMALKIISEKRQSD